MQASQEPIPVVRARTARNRPKNRGAERDAQIVEGVLSDRLDDSLGLVDAAARQALGKLRGRKVPVKDDEFEAFANDLSVQFIQKVQVALFPGQSSVSGYEGVVPPKGPPRCGASRLEGYARLLVAVAERS